MYCIGYCIPQTIYLLVLINEALWVVILSGHKNWSLIDNSLRNMTELYFLSGFLNDLVLLIIGGVCNIQLRFSLNNSMLSYLTSLIEYQRSFLMLQILKGSVLKFLCLNISFILVQILWLIFYLTFFKIKNKALSLIELKIQIVIFKLVYQLWFSILYFLLLFGLKILLDFLVALFNSLRLLNAFV